MELGIDEGAGFLKPFAFTDDCSSMNQEYSNPWNKGSFLTVVVIVIICGFGVGLIYSIFTSNIIFVILGISIGSIAILTSWNVEYYHRPDWVIIKPNGVDLHLRFSRIASFEWDDIIAVYSDPNASSFMHPSFKGYGGSLLFKINQPYDVSYRIASAVREAYRASTGTYPPEWDGYENYKKLRKRIMRSRADQYS
jgi:hypothetical protein